MSTGRFSPLARVALVVAIAVTLPGRAVSEEQDCTAIDDRQARLACYDRLHGREAGDSAGHPPAAAAGTPSTPSPEQRPDARGAGGEQQAGQPASRPGESQPAAEARAEVVATGEGLTGKRWFRLDSGELWSQITARRTDIEAGDVVRLTEGPLGTYTLRRADGSSRSSKVRRME